MEANHYIYFAQCNPPDGPIKIGVSKNPERRLVSIQTNNPYRVTLLAYGRPRYEVGLHEFALHEMFESSRLRGEWFEPTSQLMKMIESIEQDEAVEMLRGM